MKTLLRKTTTGSYFQCADHWTNLEEAAFDFKLTERAIRFVRDARLDTTELELILAFDDPNFNINLAIDERFHLPAVAPKGEISPLSAQS